MFKLCNVLTVGLISTWTHSAMRHDRDLVNVKKVRECPAKAPIWCLECDDPGKTPLENDMTELVMF
jgi:hypothetical protein